MTTSASPNGYPVHVEAELDPCLSRGLGLVKWLLAIPHYVVLAFLWVAFAVTSIVAFFSILFTAPYPRGAFDFKTRGHALELGRRLLGLWRFHPGPLHRQAAGLGRPLRVPQAAR
jgi:hypothetical protein